MEIDFYFQFYFFQKNMAKTIDKDIHHFSVYTNNPKSHIECGSKQYQNYGIHLWIANLKIQNSTKYQIKYSYFIAILLSHESNESNDPL